MSILIRRPTLDRYSAVTGVDISIDIPYKTPDAQGRAQPTTFIDQLESDIGLTINQSINQSKALFKGPLD